MSPAAIRAKGRIIAMLKDIDSRTMAMVEKAEITEDVIRGEFSVKINVYDRIEQKHYMISQYGDDAGALWQAFLDLQRLWVLHFRGMTIGDPKCDSMRPKL